MSKKSSTFAAAFVQKDDLHGAIAQLVEQRTENPCVPSSILGGTTERDFRVSFLYSQAKKIYPFDILFLKNLHICNFCCNFAG